jgi:hypothetical protein
MASLARNVAAAATSVGSPWLFPSAQTGSHLSAERLAERMRSLGVPHLLLVRNAARASLAEHMPPAMLAARWSTAVGAARGVYAGLRMGTSLSR